MSRIDVDDSFTQREIIIVLLGLLIFFVFTLTALIFVLRPLGITLILGYGGPLVLLLVLPVIVFLLVIVITVYILYSKGLIQTDTAN